MKEYAAHTDGLGNWAVIERDNGGEVWSTYLPNTGDERATLRVVRLLNKQGH